MEQGLNSEGQNWTVELQDGLGEIKGIRAEGGKKKEGENSKEVERQNDKVEKEQEKEERRGKEVKY